MTPGDDLCSIKRFSDEWTAISGRYRYGTACGQNTRANDLVSEISIDRAGATEVEPKEIGARDRGGRTRLRSRGKAVIWR
jgi:hypothetical protein